jgi:molybdenum cofactor cytidylyltransferase
VVAAIILSAGYSSRMGSPKALLADGQGRLFVTRVTDSMVQAGLTNLVVVTGDQHDEISRAVHAGSSAVTPKVARNPDPSRGQLSSLWIGMDEVCTPETEAIVVTLVDVPMVAPATIVQVVEAWRRTRAPIVRPAVGVRRGHPVIFDRAVFDELRNAPLDAGARVVVRAHFNEIVDVPVADRGCIMDVDTPEDYQAVIDAFER